MNKNYSFLVSLINCKIEAAAVSFLINKEIINISFWDENSESLDRLSPSEKKKLLFIIGVYVPVINITKKQIAAETSNLVFYICSICRYYLNIFIKIR